MRALRTVSRLEALGLPALGLLFGLTCGQLRTPGGPEILCSGVAERWLNIPAGGIPWEVAGGPVGTRLAPGLPPLLCQYSPTLNGTPGIQSMARAAATWSNALVPFPASAATGPVIQPFPTPLASTFRLSDGPVAIFTWSNWMQNDVDRVVQDGINLVTCWQPPFYWSAIGGQSTLAIARVWLGAAPGEIVESDIALNVRSFDPNNSERPIWSFVETNDALQAEVATHRWEPFTGLPFFDPLLGYADIEGVMVHEFGHMAGLAHSLVDSRQRDATALFPTMFPYAQVQNYAATLTFVDVGGCTNFVTQPADAGSTLFGGKLGASARTLEIDDISAIGVAYGTPALATFTGEIRGTCHLGVSTPLPGAHVVAYRTDLVDQVRVGTLAYAGGQYVLNGLPPGEYYVYAEPVDQPRTFPFVQDGQYFANEVVPEYVLPGGCSTPTFFQTEFWDAAESFNDLPMTASKVVVTAGQATVGIDFQLSTSNDLLTVRQPGTTNASPRGVVVSPMGAPPPVVDVTVRAGASYANQPVTLLLNTARGVRILSGQLVIPFTTGATVVNATLDGNGDATFQFATSTWTFQNRFVQARVGNGANVQYTNSANIWVASR